MLLPGDGGLIKDDWEKDLLLRLSSADAVRRGFVEGGWIFAKFERMVRTILLNRIGYGEFAGADILIGPALCSNDSSRRWKKKSRDGQRMMHHEKVCVRSSLALPPTAAPAVGTFVLVAFGTTSKTSTLIPISTENPRVLSFS